MIGTPDFLPKHPDCAIGLTSPRSNPEPIERFATLASVKRSFKKFR
jgi:hypothetical protein